MNRISLVIVLLTISAINIAQPSRKNPTQLLTQKNWILQEHGYDLNANDSIDAIEEDLTDHRKGDIYIFRANGSGIFFNEGLSCEGLEEQSFSWRLTDHGNLLDLAVFQVSILRLNEDELVIYRDTQNKEAVLLRYISVFRHQD